MKTMWKAVIAGTVSGAAMMTAAVADAAIVITISETAAGVLASGSGSFDTTGLARRDVPLGFSTGLNGGLGVVRFGVGNNAVGFDTVATSGPISFGSAGAYREATTAVGLNFGIHGADGTVILPDNYVSGSTLIGEMVFLGATLDSLGLTIGTYLYRSANNDTVTVNIGPSAVVPEPASWAMMTLGLAGIGYTLRRRRATIRAHA